MADFDSGLRMRGLLASRQAGRTGGGSPCAPHPFGFIRSVHQTTQRPGELADGCHPRAPRLKRCFHPEIAPPIRRLVEVGRLSSGSLSMWTGSISHLKAGDSVTHVEKPRDVATPWPEKTSLPGPSPLP